MIDKEARDKGVRVGERRIHLKKTLSKRSYVPNMLVSLLLFRRWQFPLYEPSVHAMSCLIFHVILHLGRKVPERLTLNWVAVKKLKTNLP